MVYNNKKLLLSIFWILAGAALLVLTVAEVLKEPVYAGMGGALIAVGVLQTIRNLRYRKDAEYREKVDTEVNDERMSFISMKSWSWTGYLLILIEGIGALLYAISFVPAYGFFRGIWYAVFHSVSAFCNAGLDLIGPESLTPYQGDVYV